MPNSYSAPLNWLVQEFPIKSYKILIFWDNFRPNCDLNGL